MNLRPHRLSMDCPWQIEKVARPAGLEPAAPGLEGEIRVAQPVSSHALTKDAMPGCHAAVSRKRAAASDSAAHQFIADTMLLPKSSP
jgi:hypothetical protein